MKRIVAYIALILSSHLFSGCGPTHPTYVPLGLHDMTPIYSSQPINLVNVQGNIEGKTEKALNTNLTEWSNQAISLIKEWFENNNIQVSENSNKYLKISIAEAYVDPKNPICTNVTLNVETATKVQRSYPARGCAGGFSSNRSAGYAINYAVVDLMHDGSILNYLSD